MISYRKLAVRSDRGHVVPPAETFTSGLHTKTADGFTPAADSAVVEAALEILSKRIAKGSLLSSPQAARDYLVARISDRQDEVFGVIWLSTRHHVIDVVEMFQGTIDGCSVHPRTVVKMALAKNAAACLLFHQHPAGVADASRADELITKRLQESLALIECRVIDHVIVAGRETFSFAEKGLL
jgi:DNA repair protein RadC